MSITIRMAEAESDRERIYRFRYDIYVCEMGRKQLYADHAGKRIVEPLDQHGRVFMALEGDTVIGTVRTNFARDSDLLYYPELYGLEWAGDLFPESVSVTTKFMVAPRYRNGSFPIQFCSFAFEYSRAHGIVMDFIDCNPHLEGFFETLGYRKYRARINHPEYGDVLPLVLSLNDEEYLAGISSPFIQMREHRLERLTAAVSK